MASCWDMLDDGLSCPYICVTLFRWTFGHLPSLGFWNLGFGLGACALGLRTCGLGWRVIGLQAPVKGGPGFGGPGFGTAYGFGSRNPPPQFGLRIWRSTAAMLLSVLSSRFLVGYCMRRLPAIPLWNPMSLTWRYSTVLSTDGS